MSYMLSVRTHDIDTGREEVLHERPCRKRCRFAKWFTYKNYEIQLRLDFEDIQNGEPMLDADIRDKTTGKFQKGKGHHTEMKCDAEAGRKIYSFEFDDLRLRLYIIRTMAISFSGSADLEKQT
jgi:hypothetical protein